MGVVGNEEVDHLANEALKLSYIEMNIPLCKEEVKAIISTAVNGKYKGMRRKEEDIFIRFKIKLVVKEEVEAVEENAQSLLDFALALNYSLYRMKGNWLNHESGNCSLCGLAETVEHVLIYCTAYQNERTFLGGRLKEMGIGNITIGYTNCWIMAWKIIEYIKR